MSASTQIEEWVTPLHRLGIGASLADLILVPAVPYTLQVEQRPVQSIAELVTTVPDGGVDLSTNSRIFYIRTRQGLNTLHPSTPPSQTENKIEQPSSVNTDGQAKTGGQTLQVSARTTASLTISQSARQISGLPGWLPTINPLPWSRLPLVVTEHKEVPNWRNPEPLPGEEAPIEDDNDEEPAFLVRGGFLE